MAVLLCLILVGVAVNSALPYLYGRLIDDIATISREHFETILFVYFSMVLGAMLLGQMEDYYGEWITFQAAKRIKVHLFQKMLSLRCSVLDHVECGKLLSRLNGDAENITGYYVNLISSMMTIGINTVLAIWFIFHISAQRAAIALIFIPASVLSNYEFKRKYREIQTEQKTFMDSYYAFLVNVFGNIIAIRSYGREEGCGAAFENILGRQWKLVKRNKMLMSLAAVLTNCITNTSSFLLLYFSAVLIWNNQFTIGSMISFMTYISMLSREVNRILNLNMEAQKVYVSMERILEFENAEDERRIEIHREMCKKRESGGLAVKNVSFAYESGKAVVLKNVSFEIMENGLYSLVGRNGTGKSSLLKLLVRNYDYDDGKIYIKGKEIKEISIKELRKKVKYIPRETYIPDVSFLENIAFFYDDISDKQIINAYKKAGLAEFIEELPERYETKVGENGCKLSGGQKQKLNIARAIVSEADILLFDESTSDLDGTAEQEILRVLTEIANDKIVIHATHREASVKAAKQVLFMENGRIQIRGRHEELLRISRGYRELFGEMRDKKRGPLPK